MYQSEGYFPRQSLVDLQFEETIPMNVHYTGNTIHKWNIDGLCE